MGIEATDADFESGYGSPTETPAKTPDPVKQQVAVPAKAEPVAEPIDPMKVLVDRMDKFEKGHTTLAGNTGRIQAMVKEIHDGMAAAQAATNTGVDAPSQAQMRSASVDPKEWAKLKSEFPEWADATEKFIDARIAYAGGNPADQAKIDKLVADRVAGETAAVRTEMVDSHLDAIVDGSWRETTNSPAFGTWLDAQPDGVKALAESNKLTDAAKMLRLFEKSKQAPAIPAKPVPPSVSTRQKRLEAAVTPKGTGGHAAGSSEMDDLEAGYGV